jgi:hypothetical protein
VKFPIPGDWDGESWCRWAVCWPDSEQWEGFLRGLLTLPQRGWTWDERSGSILDVQQIGREIFAENLPLVGVIMACNDTELAEAFQNIAIALGDISVSLTTSAQLTANAACCDNQGSGGAGASDPPFSPNDGGGDPETDPPPEGFESWEEFYHDKCAISWHILENLRHDLGEMAIMNIGNMSLSGFGAIIAISFATPIPFDDIIAIAGLLLTIAYEIVLATALSLLNDHEGELVCELYNGTTSDLSRSAFLSRFGEFADSAGIEPVETFAIKTLMAYMLNSQVTNQLYEKDLTRNWTERDCSDCVACEEFYYEFEGSLDGFDEIGVLADCFELTLNGSCSLSHDGGVLFANVSGGAPNPNGAFGHVGSVGYVVTDEANIEVTLRTSGASNLYIDFVIEFDDDSCLWGTLSNNDAASEEFHGLSQSLAAHAGKTIVSLSFYLASATAGGDGAFLVEFEKIGFFCV